MQPESNPNMPEPSTKNGRRSEKKVSNALRLTTAGSASTWPKSGLIVVVSVSPGVSAYFASTPNETLGSDGLTSGLPCGRWRATLPTVYGISSSRLGDPDIDRPPSSPNDDTYPFALRASSGHVDVSLRRPICRETAKPNVLDPF